MLRVAVLTVAMWVLATTCHAQQMRDLSAMRSLMVDTEIAAEGVKSPAVLAAMKIVPRHEFVPPEVREYAYFDMALPIGEHQTISPPFVVASMTERLDLQPTDKVLEIGTGSGYQAAVLSKLVNDVYTIEINEILANRAGKVFTTLGYTNIHHKTADGFAGWAEHAPFDKIIVTCSPEKVPRPLVEQLRDGGKIVVPLGERYQQMLYTMRKQGAGLVIESREPTFFVPMTGKAESIRATTPNEPVTPLANGDFEQQLEGHKPAGWYFVRQATVEDDGTSPSAKRCLIFANQQVGRSCQALQAIGVDGEQVQELAVEMWVRARGIEPGPGPDQSPRMVISYFDENRNAVGQQMVGPWTGDFDWKRKTARVKVPRESKIAIVAVGLLGSTGELSCDGLSVRKASSRIAAR